jgi:multiple sugar transport system permease protein
MSFFDWPLFGAGRSFVGFDNFVRLLTEDPVFPTALFNTVLFAVVYVILNIVVSMGLALWISPRIKGRAAYRVLFFLPAVTPIVANGVVWQLMFTPDGIVAQVWEAVVGSAAPNFLGIGGWAFACVVLMSVWQGYGFNMLILSAGLDSIPDSVLEAAEIDGATGWRKFVSMTLPLLSPSLFFAITMTVISALQVFTQPFILTAGGPGISTQTAVMYVYQAGFSQYDLGVASAIAWILFLTILAASALLFAGQKRWVHYDR